MSTGTGRPEGEPPEVPVNPPGSVPPEEEQVREGEQPEADTDAGNEETAYEEERGEEDLNRGA